jgi:SAM-dependent methyltransferase
MGATMSRETTSTIAAYDAMAEEYEAETRDRDMLADYRLFLRHLGASPKRGALDLLDLGCGPGRDLVHFARLGHRVVGVEGSTRFVERAREVSGCLVWQQDLLSLDLPPARFDGVFASASLFHVPPEALPHVLGAIRAALRPDGIFFSLNPRGHDEQGWLGPRFCFYPRVATWSRIVRAAGFHRLACAYRPPGVPRAQQVWVSTVWRKPG